MPFIPLVLVFAAGLGVGVAGTKLVGKKRQAKPRSRADQDRIKKFLMSCQALKAKLGSRRSKTGDPLNGSLAVEAPRATA